MKKQPSARRRLEVLRSPVQVEPESMWKVLHPVSLATFNSQTHQEFETFGLLS